MIAVLLATVVAATWGQVFPDQTAGGLAPAADATPPADPPTGPGPTGTGPTRATGPGTRPGTARLVGDLEKALRRGDVRAARALAGTPPARRLAAALARNTTRLGVVGLDLRPLAEVPAPSSLERRFGAGTTVSEVGVSWRYAGVDRRPVTSTAQLVLTPREGGTTLDATRPSAGDQAPPWLLEPLTVRRRPRVLVAAPDAATASRLVAQSADAVRHVERRLPAWRGHLVVEAPGAVPAFRAASGLGPAAARSIAAVTTTADGSTLPGSPERVFVNPRVFGPLAAPAQEIVLRHETTHVAVAAAASGGPLWLTEGFADWVALADSRVPVPVLASQVRDLVREHGAPGRLPGRSAFAADDPDLGAAYESAWLAVRLIARTHGAAALLRFQHLADRESHVDDAFRVVLGTSQAAFTRAWRRELVRLSR